MNYHGHFHQHHPTVITKTIVFYLIRKSHGDYRDEPFYYDGISDEELHHRLNIEFGEKVNCERYDIGFCEEDITLLQRNISNLNHGLCSTQ